MQSAAPTVKQVVVSRVGNDLYMAFCAYHNPYGTPIGIMGKSLSEGLEALIGTPPQIVSLPPQYFGEHETVFMWPNCQWVPPMGEIRLTNKMGSTYTTTGEELFWFEPGSEPENPSIPTDEEMYRDLSLLYSMVSKVFAKYADRLVLNK